MVKRISEVSHTITQLISQSLYTEHVKDAEMQPRDLPNQHFPRGYQKSSAKMLESVQCCYCVIKDIVGIVN